MFVTGLVAEGDGLCALPAIGCTPSSSQYHSFFFPPRRPCNAFGSEREELNHVV